MFDSTIFFSMFCAFIAGSVAMEVSSFCIGLYLAKKQMKRQQVFEQEYAQAVADGKVPPGIDPMQMMMGGGMPMPLPVASGEASVPETSTGQYL